MKTGILVLAVIILSYSGCNKIELNESVPACIESKIKEFKKSDMICDAKASVVRYTFQGNYVYVFNPGNCIADGGSDVYDQDCNKLCFLGGIAGKITCNGEDFGKGASDETVIWE